jgi:hypothetical protein
MESLKVMEAVEKQDRPFAGAKVYEHMEINTCHDQGDVRIIRIAELPSMDELEEIKDFKGVVAQGLADGADHQIMAKDLNGVTAYRWKKADVFIGPFIRTVKAWTLTHKNHRWATMPAGDYQISYPRELNLGQIRRVVD